MTSSHFERSTGAEISSQFFKFLRVRRERSIPSLPGWRVIEIFFPLGRQWSVGFKTRQYGGWSPAKVTVAVWVVLLDSSSWSKILANSCMPPSQGSRGTLGSVWESMRKRRTTGFDTSFVGKCFASPRWWSCHNMYEKTWIPLAAMIAIFDRSHVSNQQQIVREIICFMTPRGAFGFGLDLLLAMACSSASRAWNGCVTSRE